MKPSERKIKRTMTFEEVPAFLRRLADAMENKTDHLPEEWCDLPEPLAKLAVKGKPRGDGWEMKVRLKAEGPPAAPAADAPGTAGEQVTAPGTEPGIKYKDLKKRMKSSFKAIAEAIENQRLPDADTLKTFLADSEHMTAFPGSKYGEEYYPAYREACRKLARACEARDLEAVRQGYALLDQLKKDCHRLYK